MAQDNTEQVGARAYAQAMWSKGGKADLQVYPCGDHGTSLDIDGIEPSGAFVQAAPYRTTWFKRVFEFVRNFIWQDAAIFASP